ncbi:MAG: nucleotidyltransferase family protein [Patescibacteria group bacterium]|nr:nucleotidyltransferase family protein [Patescibacteria group bacterium]MDD5490717.1 nucleotidyltransferase family protein [Patescibacteria group bacterium]
MQAIVLAAGRGERLRPLTEKIPKPLLPVNGQPLIYYSLKLLKNASITDVIINLYYLGDLIKRELGDGSQLGMCIVYSKEEEILDTGGGIKQAAEIGKIKDTFVVINSDILADIDLRRVVDFHRQKKALATMVLRKNDSDKQYPKILVDKESRVRDIKEISGYTDEAEEYMFTGIHVLEPQVLDYLKKEPASVIDTAYFGMLREGRPIYGFIHDGFWADLGTPEDYERVKETVETGKINFKYF